MVNVIERKTSIEFFRFFFIIMICLWHFSSNAKILYHGYVGVEFFFILSGMFLYHTYCSHPELSAIDYTIKRFFRFFPKYIVCLIPIFLIENYKLIKEVSLANMTDIVLRFISEGLMIQNIGFYPGGANYPMWFLSVLLVGGGILFSILRVNKKNALGILLPLLIVFVYTYIFSDNNNSIERWGKPNGFSIPFVRGMADISLGIMLMALISYKKTYLERNIRFINILSVMSLFLLILITLIEPFHDQYSLIFILFILINCFLSQSIFNRIFCHHLWNILGSISYEMFLIHALVVKIYAHTIMSIISPLWLIVILYLVIVILGAFFLKYVFSKTHKYK